MPIFKVNVKWGKQKLQALELDTDEPPTVFKSQLFSLTGVLPERQKLMIGGGTIGDNVWGSLTDRIRDKATFMLMGSADSLPQAPAKKTKFLEDMSEAEAAAALSLPVGIENYGNTCYMNATLQCLKTVPELRDSLKDYRLVTTASELVGNPEAPSKALTRDVKMLYQMMEVGLDIRMPTLLFLRSLQTVVPHFGEKDDKTGSYQQQDAHECWSAIMTSLAKTLHTPGELNIEGAPKVPDMFMKQYFGVKMESTLKCEENPDEMVTMETEDSYQVSCFIAQEVKYMHTALMKGLEGTIEKVSPSLGRNAIYQKTSRLSRLPGYLTVQFVRFFVGKAHDSDEVIPKKILKDVKYTLKLDMFEFCSTKLQEKLLPMRSKFKELEEKKMALKAKLIAEGKLLGPQATATAVSAQSQKDKVEYEPYSFEDDLGSNNSGLYDLVAVLTHQGRSSSSGHYVGWVALKEGEWVKLDDDKVSIVKDEQILKLSGGGDWHVAYILLYAPRKLEKFKEEEETPSKETAGDTKMQEDHTPSNTDPSNQ